MVVRASIQARDVRELDMRSSSYDLHELGVQETP